MYVFFFGKWIDRIACGTFDSTYLLQIYKRLLRSNTTIVWEVSTTK